MRRFAAVACVVALCHPASSAAGQTAIAGARLIDGTGAAPIDDSVVKSAR